MEEQCTFCIQLFSSMVVLRWAQGVYGTAPNGLDEQLLLFPNPFSTLKGGDWLITSSISIGALLKLPVRMELPD